MSGQIQQRGELSGLPVDAGVGSNLAHTKGPEIVAFVRSFIGTPFHHQGRGRSGIDCVGLLVLAAYDQGWSFVDCRTYGRRPEPKIFLEYLEMSMVRVDPKLSLPGDWVVFWIQKSTKPQHIGCIVGPGRMVHTHGGLSLKKVYECDLGNNWTPRIHSVWRYKWLQ